MSLRLPGVRKHQEHLQGAAKAETDTLIATDPLRSNMREDNSPTFAGGPGQDNQPGLRPSDPRYFGEGHHQQNGREAMM